MQCDRCKREAVLWQEYSGRHLCRQHFEIDLESKAKRTIRIHHWLSPGDHIAVALSGDSATGALLYFLKKLTAERRDVQVSAICIDEGIGSFRDLSKVTETARSLNTPCACGSFYREYGVTMDEIVRQKGTAHACRYCRVLRRTLLDRIARTAGVTKLALGSSLDDGARDVLSDMLCGDAERLIVSHRTAAGVVPTIQPFMHVPAHELCIYADMHVGECTPPLCPYAGNPLQADIRTVLDEYTAGHPATKHALVNLRGELSLCCCNDAAIIPACARCGEPGTGSCRNCGALDEFGGGVT